MVTASVARFARTLVPAVLLVALSSVPASAQWTLSGTVEDADGVGIAGIDIDILPAGGGGELALSGDFTDDAGEFELTVLETVTGFYDLVFKPTPGAGFLLLRVPGVFLFGSAALGTFTLENGWVISGRVVNESGSGLGGIDLQLLDPGGAPVEITGDDTDAGGFYSVLIPQGTWDIEFRQVDPGAVRYVPGIIENQAVTAAIELPDVTLRVGYDVSGTVEDAGGDPVSGADIDILDAETGAKIVTTNDDTDGDGTFTVLVPAGDWNIEVSPPVALLLASAVFPVTVEPPPPANDVGTLVLEAGVLVSGSTVDDGGAGVADVDLDFVDSASGTAIVTTRDNSDASGAFAVVVPAGTYDVQFRPSFASGLAPIVLAEKVITSTTDLGDVTLPAGSALTGTVTDGSGAAVAGVLVTLAESATGTSVYVAGNMTNAAGTYALRQVPGTYDVHFSPPAASGLPAIVRTDVDLSGDVVLDVTLEDAGTPAVGDLLCSAIGSDATLTWTNGAVDYDAIDVSRNGTVVVSLGGEAASFDDAGLADGVYTYAVQPSRGGTPADVMFCTVSIGGASVPDFRRGDGDGNGTVVALSDGIFLLRWGFLAGHAPPCDDAADSNDSGAAVPISDAVYLLRWGFTEGAAPPSPGPTTCGPDPDGEADGLGCATPPAGC